MRSKFEFGSGSFVGKSIENDLFNEPLEIQVGVLGWTNGCPVVEELIATRSAEAMMKRYSEVNFWFGLIVRQVEELNPELAQLLRQPVPRLYEEPVGKHEQDSVPVSHVREMAPMSTLAGYSLPRLLSAQAGLNRHLDKREVQDRISRGLEALDVATVNAKTPNQLMAVTAELISRKKDLSYLEVLQRVLPLDWLREHNAGSLLNDFKVQLADISPSLWALYETLTPDEKIEYKLA